MDEATARRLADTFNREIGHTHGKVEAYAERRGHVWAVELWFPSEIWNVQAATLDGKKD